MRAAVRVQGTLRKLAGGLLLCGIALVSATANAQTTLSASPTSVFVNSTVTANWSGIPAPSTSDWLGLFNPGAPSTGFYLYSSRATNGQASGSVPFSLLENATPGTYELRLFSNGTYTLLATSNSFTVVPLPTVSGTVTLNGSPISDVTFTATNGVTCTMLTNSVDYSCSVPSGWSGSVTPSRGGVSFTPASRSYSNVTANQTAQNYTASSTTTLSASPTSVFVNGTVTATWSGTAGPSGANWLGLFNPGAPSTGFYLYSSTGASGASGSVPFGLQANATPGTYELRLFGGGYALLATSNSFTVSPPSSAAVYYIHPDHLNTPRMIANQAGTAVWRWDQGEPFGNDVPNNNPSGAGAFDFPLRFPGQYFDRETNLEYNYRRDYDPSIARYIESDPIGLRGGINVYAYVRSNPLSFVDPQGLGPFDPGGGGSSRPYTPVPGLVDVFIPGTSTNNAFVQSINQIVKIVRDFCTPDKSCLDHLKDCLLSDLSRVKDGYQSRCVSCYDRCRGSSNGEWPSSLENVGTCDYSNFKMQ